MRLGTDTEEEGTARRSKRRSKKRKTAGGEDEMSGERPSSKMQRAARGDPNDDAEVASDAEDAAERPSP